MSSPRDDFALLLAAPNPVEADMARELLASEGIPSLLHGQDRDFAELGAGHVGVARPDLLVPKRALLRASQLLREAWDEGSLSEALAQSAAPREEEVPRSLRSGLLWFLFAACVALAVVFTCLRFYGSLPL